LLTKSNLFATHCNKNRKLCAKWNGHWRHSEMPHGACNFTSENFAVRDTLCANFWLGKIHTVQLQLQQSYTHILGQQFAGCCGCQLPSHLHTHT